MSGVQISVSWALLLYLQCYVVYITEIFECSYGVFQINIMIYTTLNLTLEFR